MRMTHQAKFQESVIYYNISMLLLIVEWEHQIEMSARYLLPSPSIGWIAEKSRPLTGWKAWFNALSCSRFDQSCFLFSYLYLWLPLDSSDSWQPAGMEHYWKRKSAAHRLALRNWTELVLAWLSPWPLVQAMHEGMPYKAALASTPFYPAVQIFPFG